MVARDLHEHSREWPEFDSGGVGAVHTGVKAFGYEFFAYLCANVKHRDQDHGAIENHGEGVAEQHDSLDGACIDVEEEDLAYFWAEREQIQRRYEDNVQTYQEHADGNDLREILVVPSITIQRRNQRDTLEACRINREKVDGGWVDGQEKR